MAKKEKALLIVNPYAGMQKAKTHLFTIVKTLSEKYDLLLHLTEGRESVYNFISENKDIKTVICCGGDGTLSLTVNAVLETGEGKIIGYIPSGTSNDVASTLGIPKTPARAAANIVSGTPIPHDVGLFGDSRHFVYIASFGAFTSVSYETPQDLKNLFGHLAYLVGGVNDLKSIKPHKVRITTDKEIIEEDVVFCAITNTTRIGGGVVKYPKNLVGLSDGVFEMLLVRYPNDLIKLSEALTLLARNDYSSDLVRLIQSKSFEIDSESPLRWTVDGEDGGMNKNVVIKTVRRPINIIL